MRAPEPVAWIEHHKAGDNLLWDEPGGKKTPLYAHPAPVAAPAPDADKIMVLVDAFGSAVCAYTEERKGAASVSEARTALRAAVERVIAENLQRGNVIGRISAHLLGNKNNVTDEDVVIAAAEVGRELLARSSARASTAPETTPPQVG